MVNINNKIINILYNGKIHPALLILGHDVSGALSIVLAYAKMILCKNKSCNIKVNKMQHPDLHFIFPIYTEYKISPRCYNFLNEWKTFVNNYRYGYISDWIKYINLKYKKENKIQITVEEITNIVNLLKLKSYEGGNKVIIIWMPEKLSISAAHRLTKVFDDPPINTTFLLVGINKFQISDQIISRVKIIHLNDLSFKKIKYEIRTRLNVTTEQANKIAMLTDGNLGFVINKIKNYNNLLLYEKELSNWFKTIYSIKKTVKLLIKWIEDITKWDKEELIIFIQYCLYFFRHSILTHNNYYKIYCNPFLSNLLILYDIRITNQNINKINYELLNFIKLLERNAYTKLVLFNISIRLYYYLYYL